MSYTSFPSNQVCCTFTGPEHAVHMRGGAEQIGRSKQAKDPELARQLWDVSEEMTGVSFGL